MGNVVRFEVAGKGYDLSVIDRDDQKWVTSQQLGEALGLKNIHKLIRELQENEELKEGKHYTNVTLVNPQAPGNPRRLLLSYRGVIRVAMRSQGSRARQFRDWAEEVLFEVMMTGSYGPVYDLPEDLADEARELGFKQGFSFFEICGKYGISMEALVKHCRFRTLGLTQKEVAVICGISRDQVQRIEKDLREVGIRFKPVIANKRNKRFLAELPGALTFSDPRHDGSISPMKGGAA